MKRLSVAVRVLAALSLAMSMLAAFAVTASAAPNPSLGEPAQWDEETFPPLFGASPSNDVCAVFDCVFDAGPFDDGAQEVYFPAVGNADESTDLGAAQTSVTVQNLSGDDAYIFIYVGTPEDDDGVDLDNWDVVEYAYLSGGAAKTFQAADLEIPAGEVRPVVAVGYNYVDDITICGDDDDLDGDDDCDIAVEFPNTDQTCTVGDYNGDGDCVDTIVEEPTTVVTLLVPVVLAGVAKQAVTGDQLPYTMTSDTSVSGYNAIGGRELGFFDQLYFPIVQTNCGPGGCWNSILRVANMGMDDNAAVTVRFFPADDGSGSLQEGFQLQGMVDVGETWSIDLSEWVEEGWVGSAHVYTDDAVGAVVDRVKVGTDMWITNTASNATAESIWQVPGGSENYPYVLFAPDVRTDYNGWNTGINVANTVEADTDVSIQYFGSNGNAPAAQTRRLAAHGMTYFYNPSDPSEDRCDQPATDVPGCEFVGGAIILSSNPVAVAVDGVKYFGNDANVGQAFSYSATGNAYDELDAALVQKGNPATGMGATSGINVMNPNASAATVEATWLNPSGFGATNFGSSIVWVPAYSTGFVYTMFHNNLPNGYVGSANVQSTLPIVATTANVDYQVNGDGTAIWNLSNPCGFFRQAGECVYEGPFEPLPVSGTLTKTVTVDDSLLDGDDEDSPLANVLVSYEGEDFNEFPVSGSGLTNADGSVTFAVPAGVYTINLETLPDAPDGYIYTGVMEDMDIEVNEGDALTVTNELVLDVAEGIGTLTKVLVGLPEEYISLASEVYFCAGVVETAEDCAAEPANVVSAGYGELAEDPDNVVSADVPAGQYTICTAVNLWVSDVENPGVQDPAETVLSGGCESTIPTDDPEDTELPIVVLAGEELTIENDFEATTLGELNLNVRNDETDAPLAGATVCLAPFGVVDVELCQTTDADGDAAWFGVPPGNHTVTASHPDYEQEASVVVDYSPAADAADGGMTDLGLDADAVVALDPDESDDAILNIAVTGVIDAEAVVNVYASAPGDPVTDPLTGDQSCGAGGAPLFTGSPVAGLLSFTAEPGDYCVEVNYTGALPEGVVQEGAAIVSLPAADPDDAPDVTVGILTIQ